MHENVICGCSCGMGVVHGGANNHRDLRNGRRCFTHGTLACTSCRLCLEGDNNETCSANARSARLADGYIAVEARICPSLPPDLGLCGGGHCCPARHHLGVRAE